MDFVNRFVHAFRLGTKEFDPSNRFVTSWLISPQALFYCRALFSLYIFITRFTIIGYYCTHGNRLLARNEISYFTVLTYWSLGFYFLVSAVHTWTYIRHGTPLIARFPRPLQTLHRYFNTTILTFPIIVTVVYWGLIYEAPWYETAFLAWDNISQHAMNTGFALFELIVTRSPAPPSVHCFWVTITMLLYLALAYLTEATRNFYTYSFLDPGPDGAGSKTKVAIYIVGIWIAFNLVFFLMKGLVTLRIWVTETKMGKMGKFREGDLATNIDVELANKERVMSA